MLSVRRAEPGDIPAMSRVLIASITDLCSADHGNDPAAIAAWTRNKSVKGVAAMLEHPRGRTFVADLDGTVVGVGAVSEAGEITLNYVAPQARFRGVSKAMLAALEAELRDHGVVEATLTSTTTARRFYQAAGWHEDAAPAAAMRGEGHHMRKRL
jgi:GNAT superfamily N-acetyltransferase